MYKATARADRLEAKKMQEFQRLAIVERKLQNNILIGEIVEVDNDKKLIKVKAGDILTDWIKYPDFVFNNFYILTTPKKGTKLIILAPASNIEQAVILGFYFNDELEKAKEDKTTIIFNDGLRIEYENNNLHIKSGKKITIEGDLEVSGKISATGDINTDSKVLAKSDIESKGAIKAMQSITSQLGDLNVVLPTPGNLGNVIKKLMALGMYP